MERSKCDACGTSTIDNCGQCGAPQCCPKCCDETTRELSEHKVMAVTWNDDGTMTLVIEGHIEPVTAGDVVVYRKANYSETPNS